MKQTIFFTLILSLLFSFSSCSSDDDNDNTFVWEGDIEGYNPLEGDWISEEDNTIGVRFSEDKIIYMLVFNDSGIITQKIELNSFEINKAAYKYYWQTKDYIYRYKKVTNDKFIEYPNQNNDKDFRTFIRVE